MSTADSQLLLSSAIAAGDLPLLTRVCQVPQRVATCLAGTWAAGGHWVACRLPRDCLPDTVLNLVAYAWGGMGATFGPTVILALYWRRFNLGGAIAGVVVGFVVASLWQFVLAGGPQGMFDVMPAMPGFLAGTVAAVLATLLTAPPAEDCAGEFDRVVRGELAQGLIGGRPVAHFTGVGHPIQPLPKPEVQASADGPALVSGRNTARLAV